MAGGGGEAHLWGVLHNRSMPTGKPARSLSLPCSFAPLLPPLSLSSHSLSLPLSLPLSLFLSHFLSLFLSLSLDLHPSTAVRLTLCELR